MTVKKKKRRRICCTQLERETETEDDTSRDESRTRSKGNEIQKERPIERALYDWTFRAFLRKGRAGTRVLLAKTKERRLETESPGNGPRNCPTAFIYAPNRGKRCKSPGLLHSCLRSSTLWQGYYLPGIYNRRVLKVVRMHFCARGKKNSLSRVQH